MLFIYGTRVNVPDIVVDVLTGEAWRIVHDQLGSPRLVVDIDSGDVVAEREWDEFGRVLVDTAPGLLPFGYAGGLEDVDTGLVRFGARDYDADAGRWTAKDPISFSGGTTNLYEYAGNDPVNFIDASGQFAIVAVGGVLIVAIASALIIYDDHNEKDGRIYIDAVLEAKKRYPNDRRKADAFRHCRSSCESASTWGDGIAKLIDTRDQSRADSGDPSSMQDIYNNHQGRDVCNDLTDSSGYSRPTREECTSECVRRLENGEVISWYE